MDWLPPILATAAVGMFVGLIAYLAKSKLDGIARESSQGLVEVRAIKDEMLRPADLENAVLRMAADLDVRFSQKFFTRHEGERLEDLLRRTPIG